MKATAARTCLRPTFTILAGGDGGAVASKAAVRSPVPEVADLDSSLAQAVAAGLRSRPAAGVADRDGDEAVRTAPEAEGAARTFAGGIQGPGRIRTAAAVLGAAVSVFRAATRGILGTWCWLASAASGDGRVSCTQRVAL
jgi:hypothetical protein